MPCNKCPLKSAGERAVLDCLKKVTKNMSQEAFDLFFEHLKANIRSEVVIDLRDHSADHMKKILAEDHPFE